MFTGREVQHFIQSQSRLNNSKNYVTHSTFKKVYVYICVYTYIYIYNIHFTAFSYTIIN